MTNRNKMNICKQKAALKGMIAEGRRIAAVVAQAPQIKRAEVATVYAALPAEATGKDYLAACTAAGRQAEVIDLLRGMIKRAGKTCGYFRDTKPRRLQVEQIKKGIALREEARQAAAVATTAEARKAAEAKAARADSMILTKAVRAQKWRENRSVNACLGRRGLTPEGRTEEVEELTAEAWIILSATWQKAEALPPTKARQAEAEAAEALQAMPAGRALYRAALKAYDRRAGRWYHSQSRRAALAADLPQILKRQAAQALKRAEVARAEAIRAARQGRGFCAAAWGQEARRAEAEAEARQAEAMKARQAADQAAAALNGEYEEAAEAVFTSRPADPEVAALKRAEAAEGLQALKGKRAEDRQAKREALIMIAEGLPEAEAARRAGITPRTVQRARQEARQGREEAARRAALKEAALRAAHGPQEARQARQAWEEAEAARQALKAAEARQAWEEARQAEARKRAALKAAEAAARQAWEEGRQAAAEALKARQEAAALLQKQEAAEAARSIAAGRTACKLARRSAPMSEAEAARRAAEAEALYSEALKARQAEALKQARQAVAEAEADAEALRAAWARGKRDPGAVAAAGRKLAEARQDLKAAEVVL